MIKIGLILFFSTFISIVHGQSKLGIQIEMGYNHLYGISSDTIVPYGFSGAENSAKKIGYVSPSLRFRKAINNKVSIETGLGYLSLKHQIRLKYNYAFFQTYVDTTLQINLKYLSVPIICNYTTPISTNTSMIFSAGLNTGFLLSKKDNFEEIIFEEIAWIKRDWYSKVVIAPCLSAAYQIGKKELGTMEIGLTAIGDVNSFVSQDEGWGFYLNLQTARNLKYAIQLRYFFNLKPISQ